MEFYTAMKNRRSHYVLTNSSPISDQRIQEMIKEAVTYTPSAFHSQSSRVVLLLNNEHHKLWNIVMETLRAIVPPASFASTEAKIQSFAAAHGTILFYEDMSTVEEMQKNFPLYEENFPVWSNQSSGMLQYVIWTALSEAGLGASLQHYNPLIDEETAREFTIPAGWKLIAEMPFGTPQDQLEDHDYLPIENRFRTLGE